jgi:hypothetical protein
MKKIDRFLGKMKDLNVLLFTFMVITLVSCGKTNDAITATMVQVTVTDGSTGSVTSGATVSLYNSTSAVTSNAPAYTQTTDQSGKAQFSVLYVSQYYVIVQKANEKNYYSGLIPIGLFKSTADIQNSPIQSPAGVVGGVKFQDTNGDGIINASDDVAVPSVTLTQTGINTFSTAIY